MGTILWIAGAKPGRVSGHGEQFEVSREKAAHPIPKGQGLSKPPPPPRKGQLRTGNLSKTEVLGDTTKKKKGTCTPSEHHEQHQGQADPQSSGHKTHHLHLKLVSGLLVEGGYGFWLCLTLLWEPTSLQMGNNVFLSWAVGLRFLGKSPLLSKTDQPAAAEQRGDLSCARGEIFQHNSKSSIGLVLEEMKAGHQEKLMRENNRAGRAAGARSTADLLGRTVPSYSGKISFGVAGRPWLVLSAARYQSFSHFLGSGCLWKSENPELLVPGIAVSHSFDRDGAGNYSVI